MFILGIFLIISGLVFLGITLFMKHFVQSTSEQWVKSKGRIAGYNTEDYSSMVIPLVQIVDNGNTVVASASTIRDKKKPIVGTEVDVEYRKNVFSNGKCTYQIIILDDRGKSANEENILLVFTAITIIFFVVGAIIIII